MVDVSVVAALALKCKCTFRGDISALIDNVERQEILVQATLTLWPLAPRTRVLTSSSADDDVVLHWPQLVIQCVQVVQILDTILDTW